MPEIKLIPESDYELLIEICGNAYPTLAAYTSEEKKKALADFKRMDEDERVSQYGYYRDGNLLAGISLYDYRMNLFGTKVLAGGGGSLAVDLLHKKEHIALELMHFYFEHYRSKASPLAVLWPFRHDFYRKMGAGTGGTMDVYRVKPSAIPNRGDKKNVRVLTSDDLDSVVDCYNRFVDKRTGMIEESYVWRKIRSELKPQSKYVGYEKSGILLGYIMFRFVKGGADNFLDNNLHVLELIYESPEALAALMTFLNSQSDQVPLVLFHTSDPDFYHLLSDPRNDSRTIHPPVYQESHVTGVGIMYRLLDSRGIFEVLSDRNFNDVTAKLKMTIKDSFIKANESSFVVHFQRGYAKLENDGSYDMVVEIDVADFSSLIMGAVSFRSLLDYKLATVDKSEHIEQLDRLFAVRDKPLCMTGF